MNFIKLFGGGRTMQTVIEQTEAELTARLAAVVAQVSAGDGDLVVALEERDQLKRQIEAACIKREQAESRAYREARAAKVADVNKRIDAVMTEIGTHIPRLLFALQDFQKLADEVLEGGGDGRTFEAIFDGLGHEFAKKLRAAIFELAPVDWDFGVCLPSGKARRPTPKKFALVMPRFRETDIYGNRVGTRYS